jgi:hypothetical protein
MISEHLHFAPRYVRSFEIERDLGDPRAVEGYVLTPTVLFAAQSLAAGLRKDSTQRAFRITGPYGAGKSAFGLFVAHLASRSTAGNELLERLKEEAPGLFHVWREVPRYLPVAITGTRMPFGAALVARLLRTVKSMSSRRPPKILAELQKLESRAATSPLNDDQVVRALSGFIQYAASATQGGYEGVLLVVDEMGKFLEHAALRPDQADAHLFQRVAEMAAGGSKESFAIVGFLHQNFSDYAAEYGERAQEEWSKVSQRFEDIPFDESLEQYGFLLASAMRYKEGVLGAKGIDVRAREFYSRTFGTEKRLGGRASALVETSPNLYPLHPASFLALTTAVKRFGQNQRSLFSFLLAGEAYGLQHFIHKMELDAKHWYRLPQLYNYLSSLDGISFRQGDRARKWELLKDTLAHGPALEPLEQDVVKAVGLLNVLDPVPFLRSDVQSLSRALCDVDKSRDVEAALNRMVEKKLLFYRPAQADYCLWKHSSVDIEVLREEAAKDTRAITTLDDLLGALGQGRALIAHRHYQTTGTLRAFRVRYVSMMQFMASKQEDIDEYDGEVLVVLLEPAAELVAAAKEVSTHALSRNPARVVALRKIDPADLRVATTIRIWERIKETCQELRVDDFARREVEHELDQAKRKLEERLSSIASFSAVGSSDPVVWIYLGHREKINSRKALSVFLSNISSTVYKAAPILHNELVNRHKLHSATSLARQKLVASMLKREREKDLGLEGNPPERAIYLSVFQRSGLHRYENGAFGFYPPRSGATDNSRWLPVWKGLHDFLAVSGNVSLDKILAFLRRPPYGLREGPALLFIVAFILYERRNIALFERNTYLVQFNEDHVLRLTKSPALFTLHLQPRVGGVEGLFHAYATALEPIRLKAEALHDAHGIVSCIYRWYSERSEYTMQTNRLSARAKDVRALLKRAADPMELLTTGLPKACGFVDFAKHSDPKEQLFDFAKALSSALTDIDQADAALRDELVAILNGALRIRGSITQLRDHLENNYAPYKEILGDFKLKAALSRALDRTLPDLAWVDSIAALLGERTIALWKDETLDKFKAEAIVFAGQLQRWAALMLDHRNRKASVGSLVRVHVTAASGKEHTLLVSQANGVTADDMKKAIQRVIDLNPEEAPLALAEALAELLAGREKKGKQKNAKDE